MQDILSYMNKQLLPFYEKSEVKSLSRMILESVCGFKPHDILLGKDKEISSNERMRIEDILFRLQKREPIQYILGQTEFYSLNFVVNTNVLIPRPETEELVDLIIRDVRQMIAFDGHKVQDSLSILDIGTGSGCIAISLAKFLPQSTVYAIDISSGALETAKRNAKLNRVDVRFAQQDILSDSYPVDFPEKWDIIVSNPPYVIPAEKEMMSANVLDYEPHCALFVPDDQPLIFYEKIAGFALEKLKPGGQIYVETSALYGQDTAQMFGEKGFKNVSLMKDISGKDRMIKVEN